MYKIHRFQMLRNCYLRNRALKISNHETFMGPWGPSGAHGPIWAHWGHGLLGWGTTRRELKVPSGVAPRNRYFKELRVLCREFRNSLTSEKRVSLLSNVWPPREHQDLPTPSTYILIQPGIARVSRIKFKLYNLKL